ncbi:unnamed protein product [Ectocarpus sp. 13 AM-2016]
MIRRYRNFGEYHLAVVVVAVGLSRVFSILVYCCAVFPFACNEGLFPWRVCLCLQIVDIGLHTPDCPSLPQTKTTRSALALWCCCVCSVAHCDCCHDSFLCL